MLLLLLFLLPLPLLLLRLFLFLLRLLCYFPAISLLVFLTTFCLCHPTLFTHFSPAFRACSNFFSLFLLSFFFVLWTSFLFLFLSHLLACFFACLFARSLACFFSLSTNKMRTRSISFSNCPSIVIPLTSICRKASPYLCPYFLFSSHNHSSDFFHAHRYLSASFFASFLLPFLTFLPSFFSIEPEKKNSLLLRPSRLPFQVFLP